MEILKNMRRFIIFFIILMISIQVYPQSENGDIYEESLEKLSEISEDEVDFTDLADDLENIKNSPLNINNITAAQLSRLSFLSERQVNNLISFLLEYGKVFSLYELQAVDGFDSSTIVKMAPFIMLGEEEDLHKINLKNILEYGRSQLFVRYQRVIQEQKGYTAEDESAGAKYNGDPARYFFRYTFNYFDRINIGFTGEKDPGETFFGKYQPYGMDFYGGYFSFNGKGILKKIVIGNFNADFGQGLTFGSGVSMASVPGISNRRFARGIRPSLSVNENNYLFGAATALELKNWKLSLFYSNHPRDGNITEKDPPEGKVKVVSSLQETGYHRLQNETDDKDAVREMTGGGNLNYQNKFMRTGITCIYTHFNADLEPEKEPSGLYNFRGNTNLNSGIDLQFVFKNVYFFGEFSRSMNGGSAFIGGFQAGPDPRLSLSLTYRNYGKDYQNLRSNAQGKNSKNCNEEGYCAAINLQLPLSLVFSGYMDICRFPWLKYQVNSPSVSNEFQMQLNFQGIRTVPLYVRVRWSRSTQDLPDEYLSLSGSKTRFSTRFQADWQTSSNLIIKNRFEMVSNTKNKTAGYGYVASQGVSIPARKNLAFNILYALFDTESYDERVYVYENDVLYGFSVPALYGQGIRFACLAKISPWRWFDIWMKYSQTWYDGKATTGSGLNETEGNTLSEVKIQIRLKF